MLEVQVGAGRPCADGEHTLTTTHSNAGPRSSPDARRARNARTSPLVGPCLQACARGRSCLPVGSTPARTRRRSLQTPHMLPLWCAWRRQQGTCRKHTNTPRSARQQRRWLPSQELASVWCRPRCRGVNHEPSRDGARPGGLRGCPLAPVPHRCGWRVEEGKGRYGGMCRGWVWSRRETCNRKLGAGRG